MPFFCYKESCFLNAKLTHVPGTDAHRAANANTNSYLYVGFFFFY